MWFLYYLNEFTFHRNIYCWIFYFWINSIYEMLKLRRKFYLFFFYLNTWAMIYDKPIFKFKHSLCLANICILKIIFSPSCFGYIPFKQYFQFSFNISIFVYFRFIIMTFLHCHIDDNNNIKFDCLII